MLVDACTRGVVKLRVSLVSHGTCLYDRRSFICRHVGKYVMHLVVSLPRLFSLMSPSLISAL